jgi:putative acetyltransferase
MQMKRRKRMILIRSEQPLDLEGIRNVNIQAFKKENEANLVDAIRKSPNFIPDLSLVAISEDQELIGHILFSKISIVNDGEEWMTLGLAPMSVLPSLQNIGIGSLLVIEGLKKCKELGYKHIAVLGHPNFYPRFGFQKSKGFHIESPFPVPEEVFMVIELEEGSLKGISGKVNYPPAFHHV